MEDYGIVEAAAEEATKYNYFISLINSTDTLVLFLTSLKCIRENDMPTRDNIWQFVHRQIEYDSCFIKI